VLIDRLRPSAKTNEVRARLGAKAEVLIDDDQIDTAVYGRRGPADLGIQDRLQITQGGGNTWFNTVAACGRCNQRKGDRMPAEARMPLRWAPTAPGWAAPAGR